MTATTQLTECDSLGIGTRRWMICRGESGLTPQKTDAYRAAWGLRPLFDGAKVVAGAPILAIPELIFHGHSIGGGPEVVQKKLYGPGTELMKIYEAAGVPSCDACREMAQQMNNWGARECRNRVDEIVADILPRAKEWVAQKYPWVSRLLPDVAEDFAISRRIRSDVYKAIAECEATIAERRRKRLDIFTGERLKGCSGCSKTVRQRAPKEKVVSRANLSPFTMGASPPRFITLEQYTSDVRKLLAMVPHDIDAVAGVARSGLYPASLIAMWMHKPMFLVSQARGEIVEAGNGWRLGNAHVHIPPRAGKVLVVDDTVMTGGSQQILRRVVGAKFENAIFATVYCNPLANLGKPDIHAVDLEWPHLLEWNLFNSVLSQSIATDFDGILCRDCTAREDDDGPQYLEFLRTARMVYPMRKMTIPLIVTARLEKYREETLAWLSRHGMSVEKLVMGPWANNHERARADIGAWKGGQFAEWSRNRRGIRPHVLIESDVHQAKRAAQVSRGLVVCPMAGQCFTG